MRYFKVLILSLYSLCGVHTFFHSNMATSLITNMKQNEGSLSNCIPIWFVVDRKIFSLTPLLHYDGSGITRISHVYPLIVNKSSYSSGSI